MKRGQMRVGIMVDDEMNCLDVVLTRHRQIGFDNDRHHPSIFRDDWHVETHMSPADRTTTGYAIQNPCDLFVGYLRILGAGKARQAFKTADQTRPSDETGNCE